MVSQKQTKPDVRCARVVFYLTPEDRDELTILSQKLGLTRSSLTTSIIERLIMGGFSPLVGAKMCWQIQTLHEERGHTTKGMYFGIRPLPPLADQQFGKRENKALLQQLKTELKPC